MSNEHRAAERFTAKLANLRFENVFNPFADRCLVHDLPDAAAIRRENFEAVLAAALKSEVYSLWIGLELGRGGGRRTGLAMTDDAHLQIHAERFGVESARRATNSGPESEITAGAIWEVLHASDRTVFLWNIFPLHPHKPGFPLSNRRHTRYERDSCSTLLEWLIDSLQPKSLVAIGAEAATALRVGGYAHSAVRHPAYGGKAEFIRRAQRLLHHR